MKRALIVAVAAGAVWGLATPYLYGRGELPEILVMEGLFLAAAWGIGRLAPDVRSGALCGTAFAIAYNAGRELMPWTGVEADARDHGLEPSFANQIGEVFDGGIGINWRIAVTAVVIAAIAGSRHRVAWAVLAGALAADLLSGVPGPSLDAAGIVALMAAAAGVAIAARFALPRRTLLAAVLPIAVVWIGPHLLGSDVIGHSEIVVIR